MKYLKLHSPDAPCPLLIFCPFLDRFCPRNLHACHVYGCCFLGNTQTANYMHTLGGWETCLWDEGMIFHFCQRDQIISRAANLSICKNNQKYAQM